MPSPFCTLAILWPPRNILRRSSPGNLFVRGVKRKRSSKIERCHVWVSHLLISFLCMCVANVTRWCWRTSKPSIQSWTARSVRPIQPVHNFTIGQLFVNIYWHLLTFNAWVTFTFIAISIRRICTRLRSVHWLVKHWLIDWLIDRGIVEVEVKCHDATNSYLADVEC